VTPAIDLVCKRKISHTVHSYVHDPNTQSYGTEAAVLLGQDVARVFKTLVVELNSGSLVVGVVPVSGKLNLKAIARAAKAKKAVMADKQKVEKITGYVVGGVSPLAQKKALATFVDQSIEDFSTVYVSAGKRGLELELKPNDLCTLTCAQTADICAYD